MGLIPFISNILKRKKDLIDLFYKFHHQNDEGNISRDGISFLESRVKFGACRLII
jgi:hypothetical protein